MGRAKFEKAARKLQATLTSNASGQAPAPLSGVSHERMGVFDGTDGKPSLVWARQDARPSILAGYGPYWGAPGSEISRERAVVAAVTLDFLTSNPVVGTLVENLATYAVGNGLTLSSRPDHRALGISPKAARELSHQIENAWTAWATNPVECDASGRFSMHQLATAAFKSYLMTGEAIFLLDWTRSLGALTRTKVHLLDSRQLDQSIIRVTDDGSSIRDGVQFDKHGRLAGFWIRDFVLGSSTNAPQPVFVKALTSWGRNRAVHLFDLIGAGQVRGISPLAAALTPAHAKASLREFTIAAALIQAMIAITVESDLSPEKALKALEADNPMQPQPPDGVTPATWAQARAAYYEAVKINLDPGSITHLMRGDKLHMNRSQAPNTTYDAFDKSLGREAAKAAGSSVEDITGDYSQTSFSASRLAMEGPWRINLRRRAAIVEPFYRAAFMAWLEEACEIGVIQLPKGAPSFWENPSAYSRCVWHGASKPVSDPLKAAMADVLEIENGLSTYEIKLGERGLDAEETFARQGLEKQLRESVGLPYPVPQNRDDLEPEDDEAPRAAK